jgi:hypothetical protein
MELGLPGFSQADVAGQRAAIAGLQVEAFVKEKDL